MRKVLIPETRIMQRIGELAARIDKRYKDRDPLLICVLDGAFMFCTELVQRLTIDHEITFCKLSSYGDNFKPGRMEIVFPPHGDLKGRDVLIVDDILDTGRTVKFLANYCRLAGAKRVMSCVLVSKPARREVSDYTPFVGFVIEDKFVYGFGMDNKGRDRHLLDICYNEEEY